MYKQTEQAIISIKEALAEPQQEPVAYGMWDTMIGCGGRMMYVRLDKGQDGCTVPLYTHPLVPTAQPEQEPVAWWNDTGTHIDLNVSGRGTPLYTHPVKDLEDININITWNENSMRDFGKDELNFARAILRKAQEK